MKVHEAICILKGLDPEQEVTLILGAYQKRKLPEPPKGANGFLPGQPQPLWVTNEFWPQRNEITCKMH